MDAIFHGSHQVSQRTVDTVFDGIAGLTSNWGALYYGQGEKWPSLNEHAAFIAFLRESSRERVDPTLMLRVDYRGDSTDSESAIPFSKSSIIVAACPVYGCNVLKHHWDQHFRPPGMPFLRIAPTLQAT